MRLVFEFARGHPRRTTLTLVCLLLAGLAEGVGLSSLLPALELVTGPREGEAPSELAAAIEAALLGVGLTPTIGLLLGLIVAGMAVKAGLILLANRQVGYTVARIATSLRLELVRALLGARWAYYTQKPVGSVANAFATEAERASQAFLHGTNFLTALFHAAIYLGISFLVSWEAAVGALAMGAVASVALTGLVRAARRAGAWQTELLRVSLARLSDTLHAVKPLRAMARESLMGPLLEREAQSLDRAVRGEVLSKEGLKALQEPILVGALAGGLYVALTRFGYPMSSLLMLSLLFARTLAAINRAQKEYQSLGVRESAYWSLRTTIDDAQAHAERDPRGLRPTLERGIELRGVGFAYGGTPVLERVDASMPAGEITALVGPSGSGKTTLVDLVIGLAHPTRGEVRVDGVCLEEIDMRAWRRGIGYVPQELFLLHDSVALNVTLGDEGLGDDDVHEALRAAGAQDFVRALPRGIHTMVGERGALLSGGQRQRIAIARALVHRPRLLILDEATTALDPETEAAVCATVARLRGRITVLAISHQQAIVEIADRVYRVENGTAKPV